MALIKSCCCWRSLRRGCYASAIYTMVYFSVTIITMGHFIEVEQRYLHGEMTHPESESFLEPDKITPITVSLNITLLACSALGLISCVFLILGVYKDIKLMLLPWILSMGLETLVEIINLVYLFYLQTLNFNPITAFLFTLDFFIIVLNLIRILKRFLYKIGIRDDLRDLPVPGVHGRARHRRLRPFGLVQADTYPYYAKLHNGDALAGVQYTATAQHTTTTSSAQSGRRRSATRPVPSRCDPEEFSEVPTKTLTSVLSRSSRPAIKKHVQFPDEQICVEEATDAASNVEEKPKSRVISSLWMELECEAAADAGTGAGAER